MGEMTLVRGLTELGLVLRAEQISQLLDYLRLIQKWNKVYNLTAVRDPADMLTHHLLDSLSVIEPLRRYLAMRRAGWVGSDAGLVASASANVSAPLKAAMTRAEVALPADAAPKHAGPEWQLLDVGSGAGLPGVVIAICCPEVAVSCVDTVAKKAAFVQQAALSLKLPNLQGVHARVESLTQPFDVISSRAFASLQDFTAWSSGALAEGGVWMAMKGKHPGDELAQLKGADVFHVEQLHVPGLDAERCLIWLKPTASTPTSPTQ
jgi:16S rRNA (guanine527-N7)-methyltransferase